MQNHCLIENEIATRIIGCAIEVHRHLGPGLLESAYQESLRYELVQAGLDVVGERPMPIVYKDIRLDHGYRVDLMAQNRDVVEIKAVDTLADVHLAQVLTYLKL